MPLLNVQKKIMSIKAVFFKKNFLTFDCVYWSANSSHYKLEINLYLFPSEKCEIL